jgi:hypothetical protein
MKSKVATPSSSGTSSKHRLRGKLIQAKGPCSICKRTSNHRWDYGDEQVCGRCKPGYLDRVLGKKDALDHAVGGGAWESNRRKH